MYFEFIYERKNLNNSNNTYWSWFHCSFYIVYLSTLFVFY